MSDMKFERTARHAAAWMRAEAERVADPNAALARLMADESVEGGLDPALPEQAVPARRQRLWVGLASAAAVVAMIVGIVVVGGEQSEAPTLISPATTVEPTPATTPAPTTTPDSTLAPSTTVSPNPDPDVEAPLAGRGIAFVELAALLDVYGGSGIDHACVTDWRCTDLVFDITGAPISFDPTTGTITRHVRNGASFTLPSVDDFTYLVAGGPDNVVYVLQPSSRAESNDLVAYSLADGDAGREIARFPTSYGIGDGELIPSPNGLVTASPSQPGMQPAEIDEIAVPWVDRNGNNVSSPVPVVRADFSGITVTIEGRTWTFADPVEGAYPALRQFMPTFDGGFVGVLQHAADGRTAVVRGWSDGTVETWELPPEVGVFANLEPDRTGRVLIPTGERFIAAQLFAVRDGDFWTERRDFDNEAWTVTYPGLDDYLDANNPGWENDPIGFANALAGRVDSPAETRTIEIINSDADGAEIHVTTEGFLDDDSGFGSRLVVRLRATDQGYRVDQVDRTQACQPGRGHQDYQPAPCI